MNTPPSPAPATDGLTDAAAKVTTLPIIEARKFGCKTNFTVSWGFATEEDALSFSEAVWDLRREGRRAAASSPASGAGDAGAIRAQNETDGFYILSEKHTTPDLCLWWRPKSDGYTTDLNAAGVYSRDEAEDLLTGSCGSLAAVPVVIARGAAAKTVVVERKLRLMDKWKYLSSLEEYAPPFSPPAPPRPEPDPAEGWVSVGAHKPEPDNLVLIRGWGSERKHYVFALGYYESKYHQLRKWMDDEFDLLWFTPVDWMPLPVPPPPGVDAPEGNEA